MIERWTISAAAGGLRCALLALMAALAGATPSQAQQFSADLVRTHNGVTTAAGRLYVSGGKVRIESPDFPDGFFLIDGAEPVAYFVRPAHAVFMDARQSTVLTRLFVPVDPDNPCRQWQVMADVAGLAAQGDWLCEAAGVETIAEHETTAYRATPSTGRSFIGWIDRIRRFPLQIRTDDGAIVSAESVRDGQQPAKLFEMPKGARKFDPQSLIEQIKKSDVWVDAPKPAP
jgi:hypothetical protein